MSVFMVHVKKITSLMLCIVLLVSLVAWKGAYLGKKQLPINSFINTNEPKLCFSVDDATDILEEIYRNNYNSIFDCTKLAVMRAMHINYNADTMLFLFENTRTFSLKDFPDKYKKEFQANADWLKLGYHCIDEKDPEEVGYPIGVLEDSFYRTSQQVIRFAGRKSLSPGLRLHHWYATENLVNYMRQNGVTTFYYVDKREGPGYGLSWEEDKTIRESNTGLYNKNYASGQVLFNKTDLRLESESNEDVLKILNNRKSICDTNIVVFTHSYAFIESYEKLCIMCQWAKQNGYSMNYFN